MVFTGEQPPERFNMARYCLAPAPHRLRSKVALKVFQGISQQPARQWTYQELLDDVSRLAGGLASLGLDPGSRILIRMDNCPEYAMLFFAAISIGLVPIPASSQLSGDEVSFLAQDSGASVIAVSPGVAIGALPAGIIQLTMCDVQAMIEQAARAPFADTNCNDPAYLIYTSGTTAKPKGVLHAHRAAWGRRPMYRGWYGLTAKDTMLHAGAFNWTYTLGVGLTDPWALGATAVVYTGEKTATGWPDLIRHSGATIFAAVPTLYRQILKYTDVDEHALGRLRHGLTAGEALPPALARDWKARTGRTLYEAFGMSELSTYISCSPSVRPKPGSPGKPQAGRHIVILPVDEGETPLVYGHVGVIAAHRSDPALMLGYWNRPDEEADVMRGDWFCSGDLGSMDKDGYIRLAGRADDMMNARGYRVSPVEVEAVLQSGQDVAEAAAVECEVREGVRIIVAFIVWQGAAGDDDIRKAKLLAHAREHLAAYKVPGEIVTVAALPRTANGKVMRAALREGFAAARS